MECYGRYNLQLPGRVISGYLDQVGDLPRSDREEPHERECALQRHGQRDHDVVPSGQVRALMRQDRIQLMVIKAGQRAGRETTGADARGVRAGS